MDNPALMNFTELQEPLNADILPGRGRGFSSVAIDSRSVKEGSLFIALKGKMLDGHDYIETAFRSGATGALAAKSKASSMELASLAGRYGAALVLVDDTLRGFQNAAASYLEKFPGLVRVGITGSAGKTTTKEITAAIAATGKKVVMNKGNLNSETGLPLSVFNVRGEHEVGVFEAGMNRRGEMAELAAVLKPDLALITNVGSSHIGILGSKAAVAEEKKNIFSRFTGTQKAFIPSGDEYRDFLASGINGKVVFFERDGLTELGPCEDMGLEGTYISWAGKSCRFPLPGQFNFKNAVAAIFLAKELGISGEGIRAGLESVKPLFGRGEILPGKITVLRDCYNSSLESLEAVVAYCDNLDWPGRRVYVIGSMLELGESSQEAHRKIGRLLASSLAEKIFLYGEETETTAAVLASRSFPFYHTGNMRDLEEKLEAFIGAGDLVLLKGSRGCALEKLGPVLSGGFRSSSSEVKKCS